MNKSGLDQMTNFIKKLINHFKSTKTLSFGSSTIQSSVKAQIANLNIPYQPLHEYSRYLRNNYTSEPVLQKRREQVSEFLKNFKEYIYSGPDVLQDKRIMKIFLTAAEHFEFFDHVKKKCGQYKKFRHGTFRKVNKSLRKRFYKFFCKEKSQNL